MGNFALRVLLGSGDDSVLVCVRDCCGGDCPHAEILPAILLLTFIAFHCNNYYMVIWCKLKILLTLHISGPVTKYKLL